VLTTARPPDALKLPQDLAGAARVAFQLPSGGCKLLNPTKYARVDAGLCDTVPVCMESRLPSTAGTSLISAGNSFGSTGALCNASSTPLCNAATGCG
jgi:hypothetical protein